MTDRLERTLTVSRQVRHDLHSGVQMGAVASTGRIIGSRPIAGPRSEALRPVDFLVAGYNILLAAVWAGRAEDAPHAPGLAVAHLLAALLPVVLARGVPPHRPFLGAVRDVYPLLGLLVFWPELGLLQPGVRPGTNDAFVAGLDLALFGRHYNLLWMPAMPQVWLSELLHLSYFAYYPVVFLPPLLMLIAGRREALRDTTLRLMLTYIGCYLVYLAFPVFGPTDIHPMHQGELNDGFFYRLTHAVKAAGNSPGTAFPSSHVAGAVAAAFVARRWFSRPAALLITAQAVGVVIATVYTQQHWAVDSAAGLVLAVVLQGIVVPRLQRADRRPRPPARHGRAPVRAASAVLLALYAGGCTQWRVDPRPRAELLAERPKRVRVAVGDSVRMVLHDARLVDDSLLGTASGRDTAFAAADISEIAVRRFSPENTVGLVAGVGLGLVMLGVVVCGGGQCGPDFGQ